MIRWHFVSKMLPRGNKNIFYPRASNDIAKTFVLFAWMVAAAVSRAVANQDLRPHSQYGHFYFRIVITLDPAS